MDNRISKNININRCKNIISFANFNINIGKYFLGLINKHFKDVRKMIYKNNVKMS